MMTKTRLTLSAQTSEPEAALHLEGELTVAGFLCCRGARFVGLRDDPRRPSHKLFAFENGADGSAETLALEFFNNASVIAKDYAAALSRLKSVLYSSKDVGNRSF